MQVLRCFYVVDLLDNSKKNRTLLPRDPFDYTPPRHSERRAKPEVEILRKQNRPRRNPGGVSLRMTTRRYSKLVALNKAILPRR